MSAGGSADGAAAGAVNSMHLLVLGLVGGLICIYLSGFFNEVIGSVIAGIGAVLAVVWGADAIRRVASYGLGTGVPSIGYMSLSVGVISVLAGISLAAHYNNIILGPIASLIIAAIIGGVIAIVAIKIVGMKIPIMVQCTIEIAMASCIAIFGFSVGIAGSYDMIIADPVMIPIVASCDKNGVASITVSPPNLSVKLEDKATSTFPVTVNNGDSRPGKGYEIGTQSVEPDSIRITGPYSLVKIIDKVNVTTSAVNGATDDVTESGTVEVIDKNGEILSQIAMKNLRFDNEGRVTVTTHLWKTRSDISLDVAVAGMPAEGYMVDEVTTVPDTISVAGTDEALEHLSQLGNVIRIEDASVDVSGASDDVETKIDITQYLPEDIRLTSGSSNEVSVTVTVLPDGGRSYSIPTSSIRVLNKEEDMQAFFEVDRIEVRLKAADENGLDSFHEEDLEATIDLTGKEEGTYELPVDIQLPDGITLLNEVSTEVTVSKVIIQEESVE